MQLARIHRRSSSRQHGYVLLMMLFFAALLIIAMSASVPYLKTQIRRDQETEMIHRGEQYARAIKRYYKKFGRYPSKIEDLEKTNNIRFLRKRYKDPLSPSGNWRLVRYGEIQMGGAQGLMGATPAANLGTGLGGGAQTPSTPATPPSFGGGSSAFGSSSSNKSTEEQNPASGTTEKSSSLFGQQLGGGGGAIIGVASLSKKTGVHEFNKKSAYKDWLFVYDPTKDKGQLIRGPYNPNAFVGQYNNMIGGPGAGGGTIGTPMGGNNMGQPASSFGQPASGFGQPQSPQQNPQSPQTPR